MKADPPVTIKTEFSGEFFQSQVAFPVILEGWDRRNQGQTGRAYITEFSDEERKRLEEYYPIFYRWYFVQGTPQKVTINLRDMDLLKRAANFFSTI